MISCLVNTLSKSRNLTESTTFPCRTPPGGMLCVPTTGSTTGSSSATTVWPASFSTSVKITLYLDAHGKSALLNSIAFVVGFEILNRIVGELSEAANETSTSRAEGLLASLAANATGAMKTWRAHNVNLTLKAIMECLHLFYSHVQINPRTVLCWTL